MQNEDKAGPSNRGGLGMTFRGAAASWATKNRGVRHPHLALPLQGGMLCNKRGITKVGKKQLKEFRKSLKRVRAANAGTRAEARKFLQKAGVHTRSGKLTAQYR